MRTEQEIRKRRDDLYRVAILMKQSGEPMGDLVVAVVVSQFDWVLSENKTEHEVIERLQKYEKDQKKLALV